MGGKKPQGWEFNIHLYNAVDFIECIEARLYEVHLRREYAESNNHLIKFQPSQYEANMYDFNKCFKKKKYNWGNHTEGISLPKEDLTQTENKNHQPKLS